MTKIVAVSDLHGELPEIPECDLLLIAGDVCPVWQSHAIETQWDYIREPFEDWLEEVPAKNIVGIAGNHDFIAESYPDIVASCNWTYLQDSGTEVDGLKIYGSPWTPQFFNWAFMKEDEDLKPHWDAIPDDTDILITHGPPRGCLDRNREGENCGSRTLYQRLCELADKAPILHVFGHIHEGYGKAIYGTDNIITQFANVALMNRDYDPVNPILEFEL